MAKPLIAPVNGSKPIGRSRFGPRDTTGLPPGASTFHEGVDLGRIGKDLNPVVRSPVTGKIVAIQRTAKNARGLYIDIQDSRAVYRLQHLKSIPKALKVGDTVRIGKNVGRMGNSGTLKGMAIHLHFEVRVGGRAVDPEKFYKDNGQPNVHAQPGNGVVMTTKHKSRHLLLIGYDADRKTILKRRRAGYKITNVLSTWKGWTITRNGNFYATSRLKKL